MRLTSQNEIIVSLQILFSLTALVLAKYGHLLFR